MPEVTPLAVVAKAIAPMRRWRAGIFQGYLVTATAAFGILFVLASRFNYFPIDLSITRGVQTINAAWFANLMWAASFVGYSPQVYLVVGAIGLLLYVAGLRWEAVTALVAALGATGLSSLIKRLVHRPRPSADLVHVVQQLNDPSFPSGLSYAVLLIPTVLALLHMPGGSASGSTAGLPAAISTGPFGKWLVVAFGFFWAAAGAGQLAAAYTAHFTRDLKTGTMSAQERKVATWLGRIGFAARGAVFGLIGLIILQTAFAAGPEQAPGFDGALAALTHAPYGEILLGAVAIGLILFGDFSALCAKWNRIGARRPA